MRFHLHSPTLDAVIEALYRADGIGSIDEAVCLVDTLRPPMECVTMGDLFAHVGDDTEETVGKAQGREEHEDEEHEQEQPHEDSCEICGVQCMEMAFPPYPGLCARCTVKVQMVQREKTKGAYDYED
ncbi:MAG: hypothetical protein ACAH88_19535 [Roseimicrobium sp.]